MCAQDKHYPISLHELTACIYYKLAIDRGLRGCLPEAEYEAHHASACCEPTNDDDASGNSSNSEFDSILRFSGIMGDPA